MSSDLDPTQVREGQYAEFKTVDAIDETPVNAMASNPGWVFIGSGVGAAGQTTLTFGWLVSVSDPTEKEVEAAAKAIYAIEWGNHHPGNNDTIYDKARKQAHAALVAARRVGGSGG